MAGVFAVLMERVRTPSASLRSCMQWASSAAQRGKFWWPLRVATTDTIAEGDPRRAFSRFRWRSAGAILRNARGAQLLDLLARRTR